MDFLEKKMRIKLTRLNLTTYCDEAVNPLALIAMIKLGWKISGKPFTKLQAG